MLVVGRMVDLAHGHAVVHNGPTALGVGEDVRRVERPSSRATVNSSAASSWSTTYPGRWRHRRPHRSRQTRPTACPAVRRPSWRRCPPCRVRSLGTCSEGIRPRRIHRHTVLGGCGCTCRRISPPVSAGPSLDAGKLTRNPGAMPGGSSASAGSVRSPPVTEAKILGHLPRRFGAASQAAGCVHAVDPRAEPCCDYACHHTRRADRPMPVWSMCQRERE